MTLFARQLVARVALATFLIASPWTAFRPTGVLQTSASHSEDERSERSENDEECGSPVSVDKLTLSEHRSRNKRLKHERIPPVTNPYALRTGTNAPWALLQAGSWHPAQSLRQHLPRRQPLGGDDGGLPLSHA